MWLRFRYLCLLAVLAGCHKSSPLVGTWAATLTVGNLTGADSTTFSSDQTFQAVAEVKGSNGISLSVHDRGTWRMDGSKLTQHYDDVDWQFTGPNADRANARFRESKAKLLDGLNTEPPSDVSFEGADTMTFTDSKSKKHESRRTR